MGGKRTSPRVVRTSRASARRTKNSDEAAVSEGGGRVTQCEGVTVEATLRNSFLITCT